MKEDTLHLYKLERDGPDKSTAQHRDAEQLILYDPPMTSAQLWAVVRCLEQKEACVGWDL